MENLVAFFVILGSAALVVQTICLLAIYSDIKRQGRLVERTVEELSNIFKPLPARIQVFMDQLQARIPRLLSDAADITEAARMEVQHADRVVTDVMDRFHTQVAHIDHILTDTLDAVEHTIDTIEHTGSAVRRQVSRPVRRIVALARGVKAGVREYRGNHRKTPAPFEPFGQERHN